MNNERFITYAQTAGFSDAALMDTKDIVFDPAFRPYCEENLCGQYDANYSCPPVCGTPEEMKERVLAHKKALVLQSMWDIDDYTDKDAIRKAKKGHNAMTLEVVKKMRAEGHDGLIIGASGCSLCSPCAMTKNEPCRFPDLAWSCMSAYCIFVRLLAEHCHMSYTCESGLLTFFGMYVFD